MKKHNYIFIFTLSVFGLCNRCFGQQTDFQKKLRANDSIYNASLPLNLQNDDYKSRQYPKKPLCGNIDSSIIVNTGIKDPFNPPISNEIKIIEIQTYEAPKPKPTKKPN